MKWDREFFDKNYQSSIPGFGCRSGDVPVVGGYFRISMSKPHQAMARFLINQFSLDEQSRVVIVGCSYGWTVELLDEVCTAVGTDTSDYIQRTKNMPEFIEARELAVKCGMSPFHGRGKELVDLITSHGARSRTRVPVLNEDSLTEKSRGNVIKALGGEPTLVVTEEVIPVLNDSEVIALSNALDGYGCTVIHICTIPEPREIPFCEPSMYWRSSIAIEALTGRSNVYNKVGL